MSLPVLAGLGSAQQNQCNNCAARHATKSDVICENSIHSFIFSDVGDEVKTATSCTPPGNATMAPIVLVTGADGFVGHHMVAALTKAGWQVRRSQRSGRPSISDDIVTGLDLGPKTDWRTALNGVQAVVHLAARAHRSKNTSSEK
jgi:hypothetical protein